MLLWPILSALGTLVLMWKILPLLYFQYRQRKYLHKLPGWPTHWLWGNLDRVKMTEESYLSWEKFITTNKIHVSRMFLGPFNIIVGLHHLEAIRQALKEPKSNFPYSLLRPWLGEGLLISGGEKWRRNRRLLTPAFHFETLKQYVQVYNACLEIALGKLTAVAAQGKPVSVFETVKLLSLDIILRCAFSYKSDCQTSTLPYIMAICDLTMLSTARVFVPLYMVDWIYTLTPAGRRMKEACALIHRHSEHVIRERKKALDIRKSMNEAERNASLKNVYKTRKYCDFLDVLLIAEDSAGYGLTDIEIRDEVDTFMFEGHDTTTSGISWTLYCLAKYPEHQAKVREEVRNVLMGREWLEYEDLKDLKYTQYAIKEAMRLFPPVYNFFRTASEDMTIDGYFIPKGSQLGIDIFSLHHQPDVWPNPEKYDPLRFISSSEDSRDPLAYIPFSAGSRNCIGQNFAMNEEKVVVATIVNRFELSLIENHKVELATRVTLNTTHDIKLGLKDLLTPEQQLHPVNQTNT